MSAQTGIEWCDSTANFWYGCTNVSPACDHCYAEARHREPVPRLSVCRPECHAMTDLGEVLREMREDERSNAAGQPQARQETNRDET